MFGGNCIGVEGAAQVAHTLETTWRTKTTLMQLNLEYNDIGAEGVEGVAHDGIQYMFRYDGGPGSSGCIWPSG